MMKQLETSEGSYAAGFEITGTLRRVLVEKPPLEEGIAVCRVLVQVSRS